ncbi:MAG TPA: glutathione S-transferase family protein [Rhizomicrobium sp.]|jgi:glutathione S-transferase
MTLKLYAHPLSSYCHKVIIAFYENGTPFELKLVGDPAQTDPAVAAEFKKLWPIGKFPVLKDVKRDWFVPESTLIIEYLTQHYPGETKFIPADPDLARQVRMRDRFLDFYVHNVMQEIMTDRRRPEGQKRPDDVVSARQRLTTALDMMEEEMGLMPWAMGDIYTMADCAASPALFYGHMAMPFDKTHPNVFAYRQRLMERPSYARALKEAEPFFNLLPK